MIERHPSGLYVARSFSILRHRAVTRTVTLRAGAHAGERAKLTTDDSGTVTHIERDEGLDAIVRPRTVKVLRLRPGRAR